MQDREKRQDTRIPKTGRARATALPDPGLAPSLLGALVVALAALNQICK
ncbi:hypothetical protein [Seohaeicola zhoushanensis]|uniref:Uncharacterized protein n=1 Tax=Seohaeicola zhoushanensis TaxID=1569283 RepID=A0A8J3GTZ3_9RHOB|nr:hypothetical protein [Seohaeicola zhoushanensis]GHF36328.1 hypothetical protein GCM10017056_05190 [Seohaeicola zhoushanensis]